MTAALALLDAFEAKHPDRVRWCFGDWDYGCKRGVALSVIRPSGHRLNKGAMWHANIDGEAKARQLVARAIRRQLKRYLRNGR